MQCRGLILPAALLVGLLGVSQASRPKPILAWSNVHGSNSATGPVNVVLYYDPYRYAHATVSIASTPLPEADVARLIGGFTNAVGVSLTLPSSRGISATPTPTPAKVIAAGEVKVHVPADCPRCSFREYEDRIQDIEDQIRAVSYSYALDVRGFVSLNELLRGTIRSDDDTLGQLHDEHLFDSLAQKDDAKLSDIPDGNYPLRSDPQQFLKLVHDSQIVAYCSAALLDATTREIPVPPAAANTVCHVASIASNNPKAIDLSLPDFQPFTSDAWSKLQQLDKAISHLRDNIAAAALPPHSALSSAELKVLTTQSQSLRVADFVPGGAKYEKYLDNLQTTLALIAALGKPNHINDFEIPAGADDCGRKGTQSTISLVALDRLQSTPANATVVTQVLQISCYPRSYLAVGGGVAYIHDAQYSVTQTNYVTNSGGRPPLPAPSFQTINRVTERAQNTRLAGYAIIHTCFCTHPGDTWNSYWSWGFGFSNQNPQVAAGYTVGYNRATFLTLAATLGYRTVLNGGNGPNQMVPSGYTISTGKGIQGGFGLLFTFPVPVSASNH